LRARLDGRLAVGGGARRGGGGLGGGVWDEGGRAGKMGIVAITAFSV